MTTTEARTAICTRCSQRTMQIMRFTARSVMAIARETKETEAWRNGDPVATQVTTSATPEHQNAADVMAWAFCTSWCCTQACWQS